MKKGLVTLFLWLAASQFAHAEIILSFNPLTQTIGLGDSTTVDLTATGVPQCVQAPNTAFPTGCALGAFTATITFDNTIVNSGATPFTFGPALGGPGDNFTLVDTSTAGQIVLTDSSDLTGLQLIALQTGGSFDLGTFSFTGVNVGISPLTVTSESFSDALGGPLAFGDPITGQIEVVIPEPSPAVLLGIGLLLCAVSIKSKLR